MHLFRHRFHKLEYCRPFKDSTVKSVEPALASHANFRMGFSSATSNGRPTICLEGVILSAFALETCGTGYGFVHREAGTDFVHFRGKWNAFTQPLSQSIIKAQLGVGFAEIQIAADEAGFQFGGTGNGVETAGPEASLSLQWMRRIETHTELVLDINVGSAYFHYGPDLLVPQPQIFPFFELSCGVGW